MTSERIYYDLLIDFMSLIELLIAYVEFSTQLCYIVSAINTANCFKSRFDRPKFWYNQNIS